MSNSIVDVLGQLRQESSSIVPLATLEAAPQNPVTRGDIYERGLGISLRGCLRSIGGVPVSEADWNRVRNDLHEVINNASQGSYLAKAMLQEAMTTSDFPYLFGDIIDRVLLAGYKELVTSYQDYCHVDNTIIDFRPVHRFTIDGAQGLLPVVGQNENYPEVKMIEGQYQYQVQKHGNSIPFSYEMLRNDDLGSFNDIPQRFGRSCRRSVENFAASLHTDVNGPIAGFFSDANENIIHKSVGCTYDNPALTIDGIADGLGLLGRKVDKDGQPIDTSAVYLVVGTKAQEIQANRCINATEYRVTDAKGNITLISGNGLGAGLQIRRNPYIAQIATTNPNSWFLFASPEQARPAIEIGFLRGNDTPEMFMKSSSAIRVGGGGLINPIDGDFDTDSIMYKVRYCFGGSVMDPVPVVASNNTGAV